MDITSSFFMLLVFPLLLLIISLIPNRKIMNFFLLLVSLALYAFSGKKVIVILLLQIVIVYFVTIFLHRSNSRKLKKFILLFAVAVFVGILTFFKFAPLLGIIESFKSSSWLEQIVLPIGLSYYTFKSISAISDVYLGKAAPTSFINMALYICYFPEIVSGPITLYRDFEGQIENRTITQAKVFEGMHLVLLGLFKKVVIANGLAFFVSNIFSKNLSEVGSHIIWLGVLYYSVQLYYDFSGYSSVSIGISKIFGFDMKTNFNEPYKAVSVTDFWRRWHISLSTWFREYIYIPLGGNRKGEVRTYVNLFTVFLVTGIWHGSSLNFILWGVWHGIFIVIEKLFLLNQFKKIRSSIVPRIYTLIIVIIGWAIFRASSLTVALNTLNRMFVFSINSTYFLNEVVSNRSIFIFIVGAVAAIFKYPKHIEEIYTNNMFVRGVTIVLMIILVALSLLNDVTVPPIYSTF